MLEPMLIGCLIGLGVAIALLGFSFTLALDAGAAEYSKKFTAKSAATLDDMFIFMPPGAILSFKITAALVGLALGAFLAMNLPGPAKLIPMIPLAALGFAVPDMYIQRAYDRRISLFHQQMVDGLNIMSNALKAGLSLPGAIQVMVDECPDPLAGEFRLVIQEIQIGSSLERALEGITKRIPIADLRLFVASVNTIYSMGTGLVEICENAVSVIRERFRIERRIQTLTAEGRMQAAMLASAPFALMLILFFIDPNLVRSLTNTIPGMIILLFVCIFDAIGFFMIRKITNIQV